jgi:hypothetical protein
LPSYSDDDGNSLTPTLSLEGAFFPQSDSWYGKSRDNLGDESDYWFEEVVTLGLEGQLSLDEYGYLYGRMSGLFSGSQRTDAAGSNVPNGTPEDYSWEDRYIGWNSGSLLTESLGGTLDLSYGRQRYQVGSGFLFSDAGSDGGQRAAFWIGAHKDFRQAAIAKFETQNVLTRFVFLEPNDNPRSDTKMVGGDFQLSDEDFGSAGIGYYRILNSDIGTRDGMNVFDIRVDTTPLRTTDFLPGLTLKSEFAYEQNGDEQKGYGVYGEVGYDFADVLPWAPYLSYRFARFTGDDPGSSRDENFDPLFYGFDDWGTWFQGEILGEYVLLNQNLNSHTVRLRVSPNDDLTFNFLYYYFWLDDEDSFGTQSSSFADEVDLVADYTVNDNISFSLVGALSNPRDGATDFTGGDDVWYYGMFYTRLSF